MKQARQCLLRAVSQCWDKQKLNIDNKDIRMNEILEKLIVPEAKDRLKRWMK
jgi:hypothetical protein